MEQSSMYIKLLFDSISKGWKNKTLLIIIIITLGLNLMTPTIREWDERVYELNARWLVGDQVYHEAIRPPLLPLLMSPYYKLGLEWLLPTLPLINTIILLLVTHELSKEFTNKKHATLLLLASPLLLIYSKKYMTSLIGATTMTLSVLLMKKHCDTKKTSYLHASYLLSAITTLTRYPLGLSYGLITILYWVYKKKKNLKELLISQGLYWGIILTWVKITGYRNLKYAFIWGSHQSNPWVYLLSAPIIMGLPLIMTWKLLKKPSRQEYWLVIPLIILIGFFQAFSHREARYMLPILPFTSILITKRTSKKKLNWVTIGIILALIGQQVYVNTFCDNSKELTELSDYFQDKEAIIISNFWPITSYHTNKTSYAILEDPGLSERVNELNITHVVVTNALPTPEINYSLVNTIEGACEKITVYQT